MDQILRVSGISHKGVFLIKTICPKHFNQPMLPMRSFLIVCLNLLFFFLSHPSFSQLCGTRQLDTRIARFLHIIGYQDQSLQQLRSLPIEQIKNVPIPQIPYPPKDVQRIKVTKDSIPVLVFNPLHEKSLPIIIHYHGGGFISPLLTGLEYGLWQDARSYGAVVFAVDYSVAPEHKFPAAVDDSYNVFKWIAEHGGEFGGDTSRLTILGNSAGANLVAVITHKAKRKALQGRSSFR